MSVDRRSLMPFTNGQRDASDQDALSAGDEDHEACLGDQWVP
jgi:hypothetical protein